MDAEKFKKDVQSIPEKIWKERIRNATQIEMKWIAEALPDLILKDELDRRNDFHKETCGEYQRLAIWVQKAEQKRLGVM